MSNYTGCKCPVCQQPFTETDDIVVCPECGAPYHRACYQKQGGCVYEFKHGTGFEWKPDPAASQAAEAGRADSTRYSDPQLACPVCGAPNPATGLFCENCGAPLRGAPQRPGQTPPPYGYGNGQTPPQYGPGSGQIPPQYGPGSGGQDPFAAREPDYSNPFGAFQANFMPGGLRVDPEEELEGVKARHWASYLGKNAAYYLTNFKAMQATGRKVSASFAAFFFGPFYFFYRKMWTEGLVILAINAVLRIPIVLQLMAYAGHPMAAAIPEQPLNVLLAVCSTLNIVLMFLQGMFALWLYRRRGAANIRRVLESQPADPTAALAKAGGVSVPGAVISVVACIVVIYAISMFALWPVLTTMI